MDKSVRDIILEKADELLTYLDSLKCEKKVDFTEEEVEAILQKEEAGAKANYDRALEKFKETNNHSLPPKMKRFIVYWGYPGAGKSVMTPKLIERFAKGEDCLPFNIIDKDEHRDLFPNLFEHLKDGHIDECEKFAGRAIEYVRTILDLSLEQGNRSVISVGSLGAGSGFRFTAKTALEHGYRPAAAYMAVHPDVAYLSNVYRSAELYDRVIFKNQEVFPRLVSAEFFAKVKSELPRIFRKIEEFQDAHEGMVDVVIINRANELLYDSRYGRQSIANILEIEENRPLTTAETATINKQLHIIHQNIKYRYENGIYAPCQSEAEIAKTAVGNIAELIRRQPVLPDRLPFTYIIGQKKAGNDY